MATIVTRSGKGSPLTNNEVDANFTNLNTDKIESGDTVATLTITSFSFQTDISDGTYTITGFVDEDDMASNSASLIPTQQSVKAYVDAQVATAGDGDGLAFAIALG